MHRLPGPPRTHQPHGLAAAWTLWPRTGRDRLAVGHFIFRRFGARPFHLRIGRRVPGFLLGGTEYGLLPEQGARAVGAHFSRRMQPTEGSHACKTARQDVLEKVAHPIPRLQPDRREPAGFAFPVSPPEFACRQQGDFAIGGGGLEDVTGEITQRVFAATGGLAADVPMTLPPLGRHLAEQVGMCFLQPRSEKGAAVIAQGGMVEEELFACRHPAASVGAQTAAGNEIMDVRMKEEGARPGVEHTQHPQLRTQPAGIGGQVLQRLRAGGKEQIQRDLLMGADKRPFGLGY